MKSEKTNYRIASVKSIIIIIFLFGFQISASFASDSKGSPNEAEMYVCKGIHCPELRPIAPAEASFEEYSESSVDNFHITLLSPETPKEADFSEIVLPAMTEMINLAPAAPVEADFSDNVPPAMNKGINLAPTAPAEADFE